MKMTMMMVITIIILSSAVLLDAAVRAGNKLAIAFSLLIVVVEFYLIDKIIETF